MQPKLVSVQPFTVSGISVRTVNYDEFDSSKAKLPTLWGEFHGQNIAEHVPNKLNDSPIYGVYSEYESDASGQYTVTAGIAVNTTTSEYISTPVVGGQYMVFESDGEMPQAVIDGWSSVWKYFAKPQKYMRTFTLISRNIESQVAPLSSYRFLKKMSNKSFQRAIASSRRRQNSFNVLVHYTALV